RIRAPAARARRTKAAVMNDLSHAGAAIAPRDGKAVPFTVERILAIQHRAPGLVAFDTTRPADFRFTPGHYARLGLGPDDDIVWRPYSIASAVTEDRLSFRFTRVPGGAFNRHFERLRAGSPIRLDRRSFGFLTLGQVAPGGVLWLLATGTGAAPFLSILADDATWKRHERVIFAHSVRTAAELAGADVDGAMSMRAAEDRARLCLIPVVTRERVSGALGERIGALLRSGALESAAGRVIDAPGSRVMLCGNPEMIKDARTWFRERGLEPVRRGVPGQLATEGYW
ncbi:MAG TPA: ferredoxin--NADP reductase, partial [Usitatibacter sp.]|nr:ferredoxin--NADP reductase [Usitatibacter sp.]